MTILHGSQEPQFEIMWKKFKAQSFHMSTSGPRKALKFASQRRQFSRISPVIKGYAADLPFFMNGLVISAQPGIKILGVILDQELRYKDHVANAVKRGMKAALALKLLRNLKPETARKLFNATMVPVLDYAAVIWAPGATSTTLRGLDSIQRIGIQAIIGAFSTVALSIGEAEASLSPTCVRLERVVRNTWIKWHSKPAQHRFWKIKRSINLSNSTWVSPLQKIAEKYQELGMDLSRLEKIEAYTEPPRSRPLDILIPDRAYAKALMGQLGYQPIGFTDSSCKNHQVSIGIH